MDPRKNFICSQGHVVNDSQRPWGSSSPCPICMKEDWEKEMERKYKQSDDAGCGIEEMDCDECSYSCKRNKKEDE